LQNFFVTVAYHFSRTVLNVLFAMKSSRKIQHVCTHQSQLKCTI